MSRKPLLAIAALAALLATVTAPVVAQEGDTSDKRVGFSNNYAANSWRQAMLKSWDELSQQVVADGVVAAADVRTTAQNDATLQQQQISDMILEGYNAIVINAANPESLNSVVEEACAQGIPVVSFDGIVTADCAYRVGVDFVDMGYQQLVYLADKLPEGGKLLEIRGLAGTSIDEQISEGIHKGVAEFPQFEIVGSVNGDWAQDVAQQAVVGRPAQPARGHRRRRDAGRRRLRCRQGVRGGRPAASDHHHGQPPGRAGLVEGAERCSTATRRCRSRSPRGPRPRPSGSPSSCSPAPGHPA